MATFGRAREGWLRTFLALPNGIPSHDTFGRVFAALDPAAFGAAFAAWVRAVAPATPPPPIALDGKTLRRSHDRATGKAARHLVSAWADASGLVLGQVAVRDKANEIVAIPELLLLLDIRGCTVTIDARGCQTAIAAQIVAQGGDDVLALKDNHPTLHDDVRAIFAETRATAFAPPRAPAPRPRQGDRQGPRAGGAAPRLGHHRPGGARLPQRDGAVGRVARHRPRGVRLHWVLDVTFNEDARRVRVGHAARNLAILRRLALNLLRQDRTRKGSVATKRFLAALDLDYLTALLAAAPTTAPAHAQLDAFTLPKWALMLVGWAGMAGNSSRTDSGRCPPFSYTLSRCVCPARTIAPLARGKWGRYTPQPCGARDARWRKAVAQTLLHVAIIAGLMLEVLRGVGLMQLMDARVDAGEAADSSPIALAVRGMLVWCVALALSFLVEQEGEVIVVGVLAVWLLATLASILRTRMMTRHAKAGR